MLAGFPTAAIQTFAGEMPEEREDGRKPFQLDQCHALDTGSETVRKWYPKWYRKKAAPAALDRRQCRRERLARTIERQ